MIENGRRAQSEIEATVERILAVFAQYNATTVIAQMQTFCVLGPDREGALEHFTTRDAWLEWFRNRLDARITNGEWHRHYNETRPHSSLGYLTPAEFKLRTVTTRQNGAISPL